MSIIGYRRKPTPFLLDSVGHCGRFVGRAPDVDEGDGGVEPVEDDEGHRRVAQEGPQQFAVELDAIQLY